MDNILNNIFRKHLLEYYSKRLSEDIETEDDWYEYLNEMTREAFTAIATHTKITFDVIPPNQYHHALKEFMQYGKFMKFPEKYIFQWKNLCLENIVKLQVLTSIGGHSSDFPFDEFYDIFDYNQKTGEERAGQFSKWRKKMYKVTGKEGYLKDYDFGTAYDYLDKVWKMDEVLPLFSNGQWVLSDYGLEPLWKLGREILNQKTQTKLS